MDFLALGKEPISPDQPAGYDVRYEPEFDLLQAEIDKLSSPSALAGADWKKVHEISAKILSEKSKDLFVACCFAVSQIHIRRIDGLADGLRILHDMVTMYWDQMFPPKKRMRGRLGAVEFWIEKTESALEGIAAGGSGDNKWEDIRQHLEGLTSFLGEALPEPPLFTPIERQVKRLSEGADKAEQSSASYPLREDHQEDNASFAKTRETLSEIQSSAAARAGVSLPASQKPVEEPKKSASENDPRKIIQQGLKSFRQGASLLFEENSKDASAYRYRRIEAWSKVSALPPVVGDKTQVPPPPPHELQNIMDLRTNKSWQFLLRAAEYKVSQFIFWFDLNRFAAEALINLGEEYISAHNVVCDETAFLFHRLKGLDRLAFSDGTPFAGPETRQWIGNLSLGGPAASVERISFPDGGQDAETADKMSATINKAQDFVKKMQTAEAVGLIHAELSHCASQKESLLWRMALCRILLGSDKKSLALPHLELMIDDVDQFRLEAWDPKLALNVLLTVWSGYASFTENQFKNKAAEVLMRIAKIDPVEAIRIGK
ncbi:MAG: type VI secretion system protein TssA [Desulfobacteraceae bacterium]|jgi:type VI secretion system protein VasJ|nr:MAG: type VI secretion system protein TssA [Desulfobacteraceae bacterium]